MRARPGLSLRRYAAYFAVWSVVGLYYFSEDLSRRLYWGDPTPWWRYLSSWLGGVWLFALLTPVVVWLGRRFPLDTKGWPWRIPLHLAGSLAVALVHVAISGLWVAHLGVLGPMPSYLGTLRVLVVVSTHGNVLSYWAILAIQYGWRIYRRFQERQQAALRLEVQTAALAAQLGRAQLATLKMQLQPHFLFNTLNAIMVLVRQRDSDAAEETIARLSELLRCVLEDVDAHEVPLRRELHYLELYLAIEQLRFADRLRVELDVPAELLDAAVPHLGLQPLVENAVRHGIGQRAAAGLIRVSARRSATGLTLTVEDDGPGPGPGVELAGADADAAHTAEPGSASGGIGLANTRDRLQQLYGDRASLAIAPRREHGTVATMALPFHLVAERAS